MHAAHALNWGEVRPKARKHSSAISDANINMHCNISHMWVFKRNDPQPVGIRFPDTEGTTNGFVWFPYPSTRASTSPSKLRHILEVSLFFLSYIKGHGMKLQNPDFMPASFSLHHQIEGQIRQMIQQQADPGRGADLECRSTDSLRGEHRVNVEKTLCSHTRL